MQEAMRSRGWVIHQSWEREISERFNQTERVALVAEREIRRRRLLRLLGQRVDLHLVVHDLVTELQHEIKLSVVGRELDPLVDLRHHRVQLR